ncbi:MAG: Crp/Fnr family transcriptional regulator [Pyrinomonadaceae bacterium]|nr:Crp/Fnr family transcriptional regulator [Pyrinomonadaceae bacterium]MBP6211837.1 Crp/Fnr family transcriptional regulator [Pyrinomonadaceae bacterium]
MPTEKTSLKPIQNKLLAALPPQEYKRILPKLEEVDLIYDTRIFELNRPISDVYFPNSGIISLLAAVEDSSTLEVGIVGREGMAGLPVFLGAPRSGLHAVVQGEGTAMRISAGDLTAECAMGGKINQILKRYTHSMMVQISQSSVCFRFHLIEQRLARWLLMTSDRMQTEKFEMTQEFLANMLGVRREAVNRAARDLYKRKIVAHTRGQVSIVDRDGLEAMACGCYAMIHAEERDLDVI